jgi:hypothetical protein
MDKFLDYIEKYKFAIFGTLFIHILVFFFSIFTTVKDVNRMLSTEVSVEIPLDDIELEEDIIPEFDEEGNPITPSEVSSMASDANDTRDRSYEDYSTNSEEAQLSAKELEAQYFKEAAENNERSEFADEMEEHKLNKTEDPKENTTSGGANAYSGEVMISYSLKGRKSYSLPNPGYTCNGSGVVVIQIKVDKTGVVKDASYNASASSRATTCMIERALKYAKKSRFDYKSSVAMQSGTVTYKFMGK